MTLIFYISSLMFEWLLSDANLFRVCREGHKGQRRSPKYKILLVLLILFQDRLFYCFFGFWPALGRFSGSVLCMSTCDANELFILYKRI